MRVKIKFCGFTRAEDVAQAGLLDIDFAGFVLWEKSKRAVSLERAQALSERLPASVKPVLLFVNPSRDEVHRALEAISGATLQFHGEESQTFCASFGAPWFKAVQIASAQSFQEARARYSRSRPLLCDAPNAGFGGSGKTFDWSALVGHAQEVLLAGGLTVDNAGQAVRLLRPWGLDVSSGIESSPGIKSAEKMRRFVAEVRAAESD